MEKWFGKKMAVAGVVAIALVLSTYSASGSLSRTQTKVKLTYQVPNGDTEIKVAHALVDAFTATHKNVTIQIETPGGGAGAANFVQTELATGTMTDMFSFNSGANILALDPVKTLVNLAGAPFLRNVLPAFKQTVSVGREVFGVPTGTAMGGGILYNKRVYANLSLKVPKTWAQFESNNAVIKAAGLVPVIQTYGDAWTSQLLVLADFGNVTSVEPDWAARYTANKTSFESDPVALKGFERLAEIYSQGYMNKDFGSAKLDDGLKMLADGTGVQYPMLTFAGASLIANYPKSANDLGFFAQPGDNAAKNVMTSWMPRAIYIPKATTGAKLVAAKEFVGFVASVKGCDVQTKAVGVTGPYLVKGCALPTDVPGYIADMLPYFQHAGRVSPALEFVSPVRGAAGQDFTVGVGSGLMSAQQGAHLWDLDVAKQAKQLGLKGW